jgi:hypothetical protein
MSAHERDDVPQSERYPRPDESPMRIEAGATPRFNSEPEAAKGPDSLPG